MLIDALPGFEFPRKNLYDYKKDIDVIPESSITEDDYVIGLIWDELVDGEEPIQLALIEKSEFEVELTAEEIEILAILMMSGWL